MLKRVIVHQQDNKDCGICCIQSIVKYYDGYVPLEKIRNDSYTTKRGTTAFHMIETLKQYGFDAYGVKLKKELLKKEEFPLPAIVHVVLDNGLNHYMVLYEIRNDKVVLMDPSSGKKVMNITDFFWIWSEVILILYPKTNIICYPKEKNFLLIAFSFLGKEKKFFLQIILLDTFLFFLTLLGTFFLKVELKFLNQKTESIIIAIFFFIILFFRLLGRKGVLNKEKDLNKNLELIHTTSFLDQIFDLPLNTIKQRETSDFFTRLWEMFDIKYFFSDVLKNSIISFGTILLCFLFLYLKNKDFFFYYIVIFFLFFSFQICFHKKNEQIEKKLVESKNNFSNQMLSLFDNIELFTFLSRKEKEREKKEQQLVCFLRETEERENFYKTYSNMQYFLKEGSGFLLLIVGIIFITKEKLELIDFFLIEGIGSYLISSLEVLCSTLPKWRYFKHIIKKAYDFLWLEKEKISKKEENFISGDLELKDLTFSYNQYNYVIKDFNLKIKEKSHVLFLGKSGCGKSTICKLLIRVLSPTYGSIKVGKINLLDYSPNTIRKHIVYLNQRSNLITGTIKENILLDCPFDSVKFQSICEICHIEEIVAKRPLRYETLILKEENNLSGGEKQRIMLARTLIHDADIYLFDESLSETDESLEKEIIKNVRKFLKEKTIIYISHKNYKSLFDEVIKLEECNERVIIS